MPVVIHPRVRKRFRRLAMITAVGVLASPAMAAAASCPTQPTTQPFANQGDNSSYFLAPGGSFEGTVSQVGWTLNNSTLTAGNEVFDANSPTDNQSLTINGGGSSTSPYFCVDSTVRYFRLFALQDAAGSNLNVQVLVKSANGAYMGSFAANGVADGSMPSWAPTGMLGMANGQTMPAGMVVQAALRFSVPVGAASWQIDDLYIDPYRMG
jgi:hypothetical protein